MCLSLFRFSRNSEVFGHLQVEFLPDRSRNMKNTVQINLRPPSKVCQPIFTKLAFVKNFYTELHENPTNSLVADARSWKDECNLHIGFLFYFFTEHLKLLRQEQFNDCSRRENTT